MFCFPFSCRPPRQNPRPENRKRKTRTTKKKKKPFLTARPAHLVGDLLQVDPAHQVHLPRVDAQDVDAGRLGRVRELDLAVDAARSQQRRVEDVDAVRGHQDLDLVGGLEAVELVEELEHGALDLGVAAAAARASAGRADRVDLKRKKNKFPSFVFILERERDGKINPKKTGKKPKEKRLQKTFFFSSPHP